jgi:hypothetical protein
MSVHLLSSLLANTIQFQVGPRIDINIWHQTFLSDREKFFGGVHGDGAHTIGVCAVENAALFRLHIQDLVSVTRYINEVIPT